MSYTMRELATIPAKRLESFLVHLEPDTIDSIVATGGVPCRSSVKKYQIIAIVKCAELIRAGSKGVQNGQIV